jgi:hypothetical protein
MEVFPVNRSSQTARSAEPIAAPNPEAAQAFDDVYQQQSKQVKRDAKPVETASTTEQAEQTEDLLLEEEDAISPPDPSAVDRETSVFSGEIDAIPVLQTQSVTNPLTLAEEPKLPTSRSETADAGTTPPLATLEKDGSLELLTTPIKNSAADTQIVKSNDPISSQRIAQDANVQTAKPATPLEAVLTRTFASLPIEQPKGQSTEIPAPVDNTKVSATPMIPTNLAMQSEEFKSSGLHSSIVKTLQTSVEAKPNVNLEKTSRDVADHPIKLTVPNTVPTTSSGMPKIAETAITAADGGQGFAMQAASEGELSTQIIGRRDAVASTSFTAALTTPTAHSTQLAGSISSQMQVAIRERSGGKIDIALVPEELGRVRMSISSGDAGMIVTIAAERSETADLMRRHMEQFNRDLQRMGFHDVSFDFQGDKGTGAGFDSFFNEDQAEVEITQNVETADGSPATMPLAYDGTVGLDLRL